MSQCNDAIRPILAATMLSLLLSACGGAGVHEDKQFERPAVIRFGTSAASFATIG